MKPATRTYNQPYIGASACLRASAHVRCPKMLCSLSRRPPGSIPDISPRAPFQEQRDARQLTLRRGVVQRCSPVLFSFPVRVLRSLVWRQCRTTRWPSSRSTHRASTLPLKAATSMAEGPTAPGRRRRPIISGGGARPQTGGFERTQHNLNKMAPRGLSSGRPRAPVASAPGPACS